MIKENFLLGRLFYCKQFAGAERQLAAMHGECQQNAGATLLTIPAPNLQYRFFEFAYKSHLRLFVEVG